MFATASDLIENLTSDLSELTSERHAVKQRLNSQIAKRMLLVHIFYAAIEHALQFEREINGRAALRA
jgi:predicted metal-dependent hydrolase